MSMAGAGVTGIKSYQMSEQAICDFCRLRAYSKETSIICVEHEMQGS